MSELRKKLLKLQGKTVVVGNKLPDADSISSALTIVQFFRSIGRDAIYYIVEAPKDYAWMLQVPHCPSSDWFTYTPPDDFSNLVVVDDRYDVDRLGIHALNLSSKKVLVIDHHESNKDMVSSKWVDIYWRDAPSTASMLADEFNFQLLYVGMHADTLGFSVRSYESLTSVGWWLKRHSVANLNSEDDELSVGPSAEDIEEYNRLLNPQQDTFFLEAFLDGESVFMTGTYNGKQYKTVHLAVDVGERQYYPLFKILAPFADLYSLTDLRTGNTSVRSNNDSLNALMFCQPFGGGGHLRASGCNVTSGGARPLAGFRNLCSQVERKLISPRVRAFM